MLMERGGNRPHFQPITILSASELPEYEANMDVAAYASEPALDAWDVWDVIFTPEYEEAALRQFGERAAWMAEVRWKDSGSLF